MRLNRLGPLQVGGGTILNVHTELIENLGILLITNFSLQFKVNHQSSKVNSYCRYWGFHMSSLVPKTQNSYSF